MAPKRKPAVEPSRRSERLQVTKAINVSEQEAKAKSCVTKKRFCRPKQRASSKLLKLPGEIRNSIYRFALVQSNDIEVNTSGPGEPALLRVCKRTRDEGRSIYYTENRFVMQLQSFNGAAFAPFMRQYNRFARLTKEGHSMFMMRGPQNWANLVEWIKADHHGTNMRPTTSDCETPNDYVLAGAFGLAEVMQYYPWTMLEKALGLIHKSLACTPWGEKWDDDDLL